MKVKRYVAPSSREALAMVKKELGPDAVILSNRAVAGGVEILALAQEDVAGLVDHPQGPVGFSAGRKSDFSIQSGKPAGPAPAARMAAARAAAPAAGYAQKFESNAATAPAAPRTLKDFAERIESAAARPPARLPSQSQSPFSTPRREPVANSKTAAQRVAEPSSPDSTDLLAEMKAMRGAVERQLAGLAWNEDARRRPLRAKFLREMVAAGFSAPLARKVCGGLPDDYSEAQARTWLAAVLAKNIRCDSDAENLVQRGGVYALVGPTGVGKTTTVAKLAAHGVVRFGAQKVALVSTDSYRIGAQDQLRIYARILGVPVHVAQDASELEHTLRALADRHLVLIDTVGMGQRDTRLAEQLTLLAGKRVQRILLLNATAQLETLEDVIQVYKGGSAGQSLAGAIITKVDESRRPGGALDAAIRHKLKLAFITDGQRVPEDIHAPVATSLVERALEGAGDSPFALEDDEFMMLSAGVVPEGL